MHTASESERERGIRGFDVTATGGGAQTESERTSSRWSRACVLFSRLTWARAALCTFVWWRNALRCSELRNEEENTLERHPDAGPMRSAGRPEMGRDGRCADSECGNVAVETDL